MKGPSSRYQPYGKEIDPNNDRHVFFLLCSKLSSICQCDITHLILLINIYFLGLVKTVQSQDQKNSQSYGYFSEVITLTSMESRKENEHELQSCWNAQDIHFDTPTNIVESA